MSRKSIKLGKNVRINLNKKSVGLSIGGKHGRFSVNSNGRTSTTFKPFKGFSITSTSSPSKKKSTPKRKPAPKRQVVNTTNQSGLKTNMGLLIVTILFGWLGIQRYASGQILLGILYSCTFGLFGIGWFYDIYKEVKGVFFQSLY